MRHYLTIPFLLLVVCGYLYTGLMSLDQVYFDAPAVRQPHRSP